MVNEVTIGIAEDRDGTSIKELLNPPSSLLTKLGNAVVHAERIRFGDERSEDNTDVAAFDAMLHDPEVRTWLEHMQKQGMISK